MATSNREEDNGNKRTNDEMDPSIPAITKTVKKTKYGRIRYRRWEPCKIGVRQGECLSPFLFAMYINDLDARLAENGVCNVM